MLIGDMAIKNLAPKDANSGGRIIKNMRICGSGLYEYAVSEAALMGITIPGDYKESTFFVLRPAETLIANKDLYARVPIITGHHVRVDTSNAKQLAVGMVGDTVQAEVGDDGETYLYTTGTIIAGDGIEAYERYGELSVGYDPIIKWQPGVYKGRAYQAVLTGFKEINHLLICKTARGGHQCCVMDEQPWGLKILSGGKNMGFFSKIFGSPKAMTGDERVVDTLLQSITVGADSEVQIAKVRGIIGDCKDNTFNEYLDEMAGASKSGADADTIAKAINVVSAYYHKNIAGDEQEKVCEECGKSPCECDKSNGDEPAKEEAEAPAKEEAEAVNGDELKAMVGDAVKAAFEDIDARIDAAIQKRFPVKENTAPVAGDSVAEDSSTSDDMLKNIF